MTWTDVTIVAALAVVGLVAIVSAMVGTLSDPTPVRVRVVFTLFWFGCACFVVMFVWIFIPSMGVGRE